MEQQSHHTRNSAGLTSAFSSSISGFPCRLGQMVPFENVKRWLYCSRLGVGIRPRDRSATAFRPVRAELLRRCGRWQIKLAFRIAGSARRGTTLCPLSTEGKYASGFMTHNEVTNTQQLPEQ